jgi:hypothetical protein
MPSIPATTPTVTALAVALLAIPHPTHADVPPASPRGPAAEAAVAQTPARSTDLSGLALPAELDRGDWTPVVVRPIDGRTAHHPTYVRPIGLGDDATSPLDPPTPSARLDAALQDARPMHYEPPNLVDTAMGWGGFAADVATAVPRMLVQPPLAPVTTPPGVSDASLGFFFPEPVEVEGGDAFPVPPSPASQDIDPAVDPADPADVADNHGIVTDA